MPPYMFNPWMYFSTMQNAASAAGGFMPPGMFPPFYQSPATSGTPGQAEHPNASTTTTSTSVGDGVKSDGNGEKQNAESKTPTTSAMGPPPYGGMFYYPYGPMMNPWGFPPMGNFPQPIPTTSAMANTNNSTEMKQSESRQKTNTSGLSGNSKKSEMVKKTANTETQAKSTESASVVGANKSTPVEKSDNDSDGEGSDDEEISLDDGDDSSVDEGEAEFIAAQMRLYQQVKSNSGAETQPLLDEASGDYEGPTGSVRSLPPS